MKKWTSWEKVDDEKQAALLKFDEKKEDSSPIFEISFFFEQSIMLIKQVFNITSYYSLFQ